MISDDLLDKMNAFVISYGLKLLGAIAVAIIGLWILKIVVKGVNRMLTLSKIDETLKPFLVGTAEGLLKVLLAITVLGVLGVEMTSFIAILGAVSLAVGMALSGTLQNFAGGVMLILFKPFKVGDVIDAQGYLGSVSEIQIFNTILKTPDNKTIIIPNGGLSTGAMINYSTEKNRRVDWVFGIGYGDNISKAEAIIKKLCDEDQRILKDPETFIAVSELADNSVNFTVRAWVKAENYWPVYFDMNKNIYEIFNKEGLNIPYPQMDVHLHKN